MPSLAISSRLPNKECLVPTLRDITISLEWLSRVSPRAFLRLRENLAKNRDIGNAFSAQISYKPVKKPLILLGNEMS